MLQPTQTDDDVRAACSCAPNSATASVCVKPSHVPLAAECLRGSSVLVSTVIGFPHGGTTTETKVAETELACRQGAREVDMVVNIGKVLSGDWDYVEQRHPGRGRCGPQRRCDHQGDLRDRPAAERRHSRSGCARSARRPGRRSSKRRPVSGTSNRPNGQMTATGATEARRAADAGELRHRQSQVKASGGIRSYEDARRFVELGATRLGHQRHQRNRGRRTRREVGQSTDGLLGSSSCGK